MPKSAHNIATLDHVVLVTAQALILYQNIKGSIKSRSVELAEGTIVQGKVENVEGYMAAVQGLLQGIKVSGQEIGLCVPEHIMFVKKIEMASTTLPQSQMVIWEVQQLLPYAIEEMQVGWEIIKLEEGSYHIQVKAVSKKDLDRYQSPFTNLGFMVVSLESPSLALARSIKDLPHPTLLIDDSTGVGMVVLYDSTGGAVLVSVTDQVPDEVEQLAHKMVEYYKTKSEETIKTIVVNGPNQATWLSLASELVGEAEVSSLDQAAMSQALVTKPKTDPMATGSSELVTQNSQTTLEQGTFKSIWLPQLMGRSLIIILLLNIVACGFVAKAWWDKRMIAESAETAQSAGLPSIKELVEVEKVVRQVQTTLEIGPQRTSMPHVLSVILETLGENIGVEAISIDMEKQEATISGRAETQEELLSIVSALDSQPEFTDVRVPPAAFETLSNISYSVTFTWQLDTLDQ